MEMGSTQSFSTDIKQYLSLFWHWLWLLVILSILAGAFTYFFSYRQPKIYQASATVIIDQPSIYYDYYTIAYINESLAQTFSKLMVQQPTLEGVIQRLDLNLSVSQLGQSLKVEPIPDTQLLRISIEDTDPERAAEVVNTIGIVFAEENQQMQASRYKDTKDSLQTQMQTIDQQVQDTSKALDAIASTTEINTQGDILQVQLDTYREIYQALLTQIVTIESQPSSSENNPSDTGDVPLDQSFEEQRLTAVETKILDLSGQIKALGWVRDAQYDLLTTQLSAYESLYQKLLSDLVLSSDNSGDILGNVGDTTDIETLSAQLEVTEAQIQELTLEINKTGGGGDGVERDRLESNLALYRQTYANLVQSYEQVRLAEIQNTTRVDLVQPATPPTNPIRPNVTQNTMLGALVGLLVGAGIAFLIEMLDDTVNHPDDIEKLTNLPTLAGIAHIAGERYRDKLVTVQYPRSPISEAYRSLRTNIQFATIDLPENKKILVTSPNPMEGKSVTVANLAAVIAQAGNKVLVMDTDLRKPVQHRLFQLPNKTGLTDFLLGVNENQIQDEIKSLISWCIQKTDVEGLNILTSGSLPPNPSELLGSEKMKNTLAALSEFYDYIIMDSPPELIVTDAAVISSQTDAVVLVINANATTKHQLKQAVESLRGLNRKNGLIGVVLNDLSAKRNSYYHNYYYYKKSYYRDGYTGYGMGSDNRSSRILNGKLFRSLTGKSKKERDSQKTETPVKK
jgi:succinoglycan biosynthesis transport protein ExoP